jgi:hypothetical protein
MLITYGEDTGKEIDKVMATLDAMAHYQKIKPELIRRDKALKQALDTKRSDLKNPSEHFKKMNAAHRRIVASIPIEISQEIKKKYGNDSFTDRNKFWEIMNLPENKMFLLDKK